MKRISFVKQSKDDQREHGDFERDIKPATCGKVVAKEYRDLCIVEDEQKKSAPLEEHSRVRSQPTRTVKQQSKHRIYRQSDLFKICQSGDHNKLAALIEDNKRETFVDFNVCDSFGWTPLMITACAGHLRLVKLLVEQTDFQLDHRCSKGLSLEDICHKFKRKNILEYLKNRRTIRQESSLDLTPTEQLKMTQTVETFECEFCGLIQGVSQVQHSASIAHQLASRSSSSSAPLSLGAYAHLDREYKGYQLLRAEGWNGFTGLGTREDGRKYPITAKVRQDRSGIGHPRSRETPIEKLGVGIAVADPARSSDVRIPKKKLKLQMANRDRKDRKIAARFRQEFYSDS